VVAAVVVVTSKIIKNKMVGTAAAACVNIASRTHTLYGFGQYHTSKNMIYFTPLFYYRGAKLMDTVSSSNNKPISWFREFIGVGYRYHDVYMNVIPLFEDKVPAYRLWKKTIEWWPDDEIKVRFVEESNSYWLIIYGGSTYKGDNTGFVKKVQVSDHYKRFKAGYEKKAILRFGIYKENPKKKDDDRKYDLEILKKSKSVYDIAFLKYEELSPESIEWQCIEENKK
jgi:hypothetical protein